MPLPLLPPCNPAEHHYPLIHVITLNLITPFPPVTKLNVNTPFPHADIITSSSMQYCWTSFAFSPCNPTGHHYLFQYVILLTLPLPYVITLNVITSSPMKYCWTSLPLHAWDPIEQHYPFPMQCCWTSLPLPYVITLNIITPSPLKYPFMHGILLNDIILSHWTSLPPSSV